MHQRNRCICVPDFNRSVRIASDPSIQAALDAWGRQFDPYLDDILRQGSEYAPELTEAMRYSALAPGKRFRPYLVAASCRLCGGTDGLALPVAAAMECVHAFSLVHDDLPAMDDDDLRRGRPTCHKVFGEAMAILAGDALLALAFEILVTRTAPSVDRVGLVRILAEATGRNGMIGGQAADILGERLPPSLQRVRQIHAGKTAALISASCRMGAVAAGADAAAIEALGRYGRHVGMAFQIADDLLDLTSTPQQLGKATAKDAEAHKQTYPAVVGMESARLAAGEETAKAIEALKPFGAAADNLRSLARFVIERQA